ncbi:MAG: helix-turn-helix domain-containing protein [Oligoflexia bacterium]|nr:helix-turn-helix domain-containing protein [Oligoflexia bacterium]
MINQEKVKAVMELHREGVQDTKIAKLLNIDRKTVSNIISRDGNCEQKTREDKLELDDELIRKIFNKCAGYGERTHEELGKMGIKIGYSTLMRKLRELGLKGSKKSFATSVPDEAGEEFQHDLSPYKLDIGGVRTTLQASSLHYRYSKINYLQFYPSFNRFKMKCFFYQAIKHFGYVPKKCIVDNTSLVIDRGSGKNAVFNREMIDFAKGLQFEWYAHEINHSDRKAGVERSFWTIETNFFPGREFTSLEDINRQALTWCEYRSKKMNKQKIIPFDRFEHEKNYMSPMPPYVMAPYQQLSRVIDQEGYILLGTNLYWVGLQRNMEVTVLEFLDHLKIYHKRKIVSEYPLPPYGTRQKKFRPKGMNIPYRPKKTTVPPNEEEHELRKDPLVNEYLSLVLLPLGPQSKYQFIRQLYHLYKNLTPLLFKQVIERALQYKVSKKSTLERIAVYLMNKDEVVIDDFNLPPDGEEILYGKEPDFTNYNYDDSQKNLE